LTRPIVPPSVKRRVTITPVTPKGPALRFDLVDEDTLSGGAGGWEDLARPRRRAATEWTGTPLYTYVLPLLLSGMEHQVGVDKPIESEIRALTSWGHRTHKTGEPPILRISGPIRVPTSLRWVIADTAWGQQTRNRDGRRIQQYVTLTLKEHVEAVILKGPASKSKHGHRQ
jgi:hypothetical protein